MKPCYYTLAPNPVELLRAYSVTAYQIRFSWGPPPTGLFQGFIVEYIDHSGNLIEEELLVFLQANKIFMIYFQGKMQCLNFQTGFVFFKHVFFPRGGYLRYSADELEPGYSYTFNVFAIAKKPNDDTELIKSVATQMQQDAG